MEQKISEISVSKLLEMVHLLKCDDREESNMVLDAILKTLEERIPENEFIHLCETL